MRKASTVPANTSVLSKTAPRGNPIIWARTRKPRCLPFMVIPQSGFLVPRATACQLRQAESGPVVYQRNNLR